MKTREDEKLDSIRLSLRRWILQHARGVDDSTLDVRTPLLAGRHLTSLQVPELLLFIESLRRAPIDVANLREGDLNDIASIEARFFTGVSP